MNRQLIRKGVQLSVLGALVASPLLAMAKIGFAQGTLCAVGTGDVVVACPVGTAQVSLASRSFDGSLVVSSLAWVGLALLGGRVFCSRICPQGFASEIGDKLRNLAHARVQKPDSKTRRRRKRMLIGSVFGAVLASSLIVGIPAVRVVREPKKCVGCKSCEAACPMGESPMHSRITVSCTNCAICVDDCPEGALVMGETIRYGESRSVSSRRGGIEVTIQCLGADGEVIKTMGGLRMFLSWLPVFFLVLFPVVFFVIRRQERQSDEEQRRVKARRRGSS